MLKNRFGRLLRRLPLLLPLLAVACASSDPYGGGGPSQERTLDLIAIAVGSAVLIGLTAIMYYDNQNN